METHVSLPRPEIHPGTRLGPVHLTVASLEREVEFYRRAIGLTLHGREGEAARLGAGAEDLLVLHEAPRARRARGTTGLYHFAVLVPTRGHLALAIARLAQLRVPQAPTDHTLTQSTYLDDPEGNGIEIYADTPEFGTWFMENGQFAARDRNGQPRSGRDPLDLEELMTHLPDGATMDTPLPPETKIGHVHLHVADIDRDLRFYRDVLGFGEQVSSGHMAFVSAGGYHHHIGINTWVGPGAPPPPDGSLGLDHYTVVVPDQDELDRVVAGLSAAGQPAEPVAQGVLTRDPSRNRLLLTVARP